MDNSTMWIVIACAVLLAVIILVPIIVNAFYRTVDAGQILLVSRPGGGPPRVHRGPCKAWVIPLLTATQVIPAQAINVDIDITDQTADVDANGRPAPVKVNVKASAIVSVGESDSMVITAANKFFSKPQADQLSTLTDVLSSAGRRAINLLTLDQLFNARTAPSPAATTSLVPAGVSDVLARGEDDALAVIIKEACSRELQDLGLTFNSLNIKAVLSDVAEARRRESAARAKASADVVQAQEEQRARIAQLVAQQKINDQERELNMQIAANGAAVARAEAERMQAVRTQREAELAATQITQARADAEQTVIKQEAEGRAQAARIRAIAAAEAESIQMKAKALAEAGPAYLELRRLELAPELTRQISAALANGQFINFGTAGNDGHTAATTASDDVMRVVQTLMAAQVIANSNFGGNHKSDETAASTSLPSSQQPAAPSIRPASPPAQPAIKPDQKPNQPSR
jgi:flotillin